MKLVYENKKYYFGVMLTEFIILSGIYWFVFLLNLSSFLVYILAAGFYITACRFWLDMFEKKNYKAMHFLEHFSLINIIVLSAVLAADSIIYPIVYNDMFYVYIGIFAIFVFYYIYRLLKEKKDLSLQKVSVLSLSTSSKFLILLSLIFLLFDFFVFLSGKLNIQLVLYLPFLFLILTFIFFIYRKFLSFNSFLALVLFLNVYVVSTFLLVINFINSNFFSLVLILHFIIFFAAVALFRANSVETKDDDFLYSKEIMALLFANTVLVFISLNNILALQVPAIFLSYIFFITILLISYIVYYNYKIYIKY